MAEPISTSAATATLAVVSLVAMFPGISAEIVLGAFAGAVVFVLSAKELSVRLKLAFFMLSMIAGIVCASMAAQLLASVLPARVVVSNGVGGLLASSIVIRLLLWLINRAQDPSAALAEWKEKKW